MNRMGRNICLITYCGAYNYGAALQLFATYKKLEQMGNRVTVLNYENKFEGSQKSLRFLFTSASLKKRVRTLIASYVFGAVRNGEKNFADFYRGLHYTAPVSGMAAVEKMTGFDVFCVGSDQVWNPRITDGFDEVFTLKGQLPVKISYSSSMGSLQFDGYDEGSFLSALSDFDSISVRESGAYEYLRAHLPGKAVEQVVDPTILYGKDGWDAALRAAGVEKTLPGKYVLVYALGGCFSSLQRLANKVAAKMGAKVAAVTISSRPRKVDHLMDRATPLEFVDLIKNAAFVVTNSFHGTSFSLLYGTPFYSVRFGDNPARAEELLAKYHLSGRLYRDGDALNDAMLRSDDICQAQIQLKDDAAASEKWLEGALS